MIHIQLYLGPPKSPALAEISSDNAFVMYTPESIDTVLSDNAIAGGAGGALYYEGQYNIYIACNEM